MRKLTVKRNKTFVGCLAKIHIYVEDAAGEMTINNIPCRKLGELKNGSEATFEIEEDARRVFAVADKISKDYCNDCYQLPKGCDDIILSGKCRLNPAAGNAFCFDGNETVPAKLSKKRKMRLGLTVLIVSILIGAVLGFTVTSIVIDHINSQEKVFYTGNMSITLNRGFTQQNVSGFSAVFSSKKADVFVQYYPDIEAFEDYTAEDFAKLLANELALGEDKVETNGELTHITYIGTQSDGKKYRYRAYIYKDDGDFWVIQFSVKESSANRYADDIEKWAGSVSFN